MINCPLRGKKVAIPKILFSCPSDQYRGKGNADNIMVAEGVEEAAGSGPGRSGGNGGGGNRGSRGSTDEKGSDASEE